MLVSTAPRRWFRFSLQTMFALVTIFALWLGWELHFIRARRSFVARVKQDGTGLANTPLEHSAMPEGLAPPPDELWKLARIPFWRRWLGDEGYYEILVPESLHDELDYAKRLFPEAGIAELRGKWRGM